MKLEGIPEGYEAVRYGRAVPGETFLDSMGRVSQATIEQDSPRLIIRELPPPVLVKPGVFNDGWVAQDSDQGSRRVFWFGRQPRPENGKWEPADGCLCCEVDGDCIRKEIVQFRDDIPWTERLVQVGPAVEK